ncbi:MAG: TonB-dependent receptor [Cystobacterineae bacterium]|nr:TonB-dependent receptor [Cystobacterineae bacterium]
MRGAHGGAATRGGICLLAGLWAFAPAAQETARENAAPPKTDQQTRPPGLLPANLPSKAAPLDNHTADTSDAPPLENKADMDMPTQGSPAEGAVQGNPADMAHRQPGEGHASGGVDEGTEAAAKATPETAFVEEIKGRRTEAGLWEVGPEAFKGRRSFEALSYEVPGWFASSNGGLAFGIGANSSGQLALRGLGGRPTTQLLVIEDGIPDVMGLFGHPLADAHPSSFLASARVLPGGDSVLYGSGAMAGTLLLETRGKAVPLRQGEAAPSSLRGLESLSLETELGGGHTAQGMLSATGGGAAHAWGGFVRMARSEGYRPFSAAQQADALAKVEWAPGGGLKVALRSRVDAFSGMDPGPVHAPFENHNYEALRLSQSIGLQGLWGAHSLSATTFANLGFHRFWDGFSSRDGLFGLMAQHRYSQQSLQLLWGVDARLTTGFARREEVALSEGTHSEASLGLYAQAQWQPKPLPLRAIAGGRFQHVAGQNFGLGKAELYYAPLQWLEAYARYFQNFRSPTLSERYLAMPVANPNLKVERSNTADLGLNLQSPLGHFKLAGFLTKAQNLIALSGAPPALSRENVERLTVPGLEAQWTLHKQSWTGSLSFSRQWPDTRAMRIPHTQLAAHMSFSPFPLWRLSLSAAMWHGLLTEQLAAMPPLSATEARLEYMPLPNIRLWLRASNLLGQKRAFNFGYPLPGFQMFAGMQLEMGA